MVWRELLGAGGVRDAHRPRLDAGVVLGALGILGLLACVATAFGVVVAASAGRCSQFEVGPVLLLGLAMLGVAVRRFSRAE